ncbi:DUF4190 domain-containing protein [Actinosynnema sp. NPDC053489]|uniref:DUF4190 domain-containing protein n=1 Tax=Actinosynnema sp. NPDC053489 TaxID=3363916 RepID=UPI0037CCB315
MPDPRRNVPGTVGFALGLLGLALGFVPVLGVVAWPLVAVGLGLSLLGLVRATRGPARGRGLAVAGVVLSAVGLGAAAAWAVLFGRASSDAENALDDLRVQGGRASVLRYEVTGDVPTAAVSYAGVVDEVVALPWTREFTVKGGFDGGTLDVRTGPGGGTVTCRLTVDGAERGTATASGPNAVASCSG